MCCCNAAAPLFLIPFQKYWQTHCFPGCCQKSQEAVGHFYCRTDQRADNQREEFPPSFSNSPASETWNTLGRTKVSTQRAPHCWAAVTVLPMPQRNSCPPHWFCPPAAPPNVSHTLRPSATPQCQMFLIGWQFMDTGRSKFELGLRCWLPFLSGGLFGNMIKVITLERSCAFFHPSVPPRSPPCLPPAKTLAHGHVSPRFSLFYYFKRARPTPFITEHCSCQSCNRVKLFRHSGIEQSPTRISKPDVIQGGIIPSCDSSLICDLDPICTHMYLWLIPSWFSHHRIQELAKSIFIH